MNDYWKKLDVAEDLIKEIFSDGAPSFQDSKPGYLDIMFYSYFGTSDVVKECFGIDLLIAGRYPLLTSWINALSEVPEFKELTPPKDKLLQNLRAVLPKYMSKKAAE